METITHASFGELLRAFRKRRKLRQQELADLLGIHRNTIGTWERGEYLPEYKGMVLELARVLFLDEAETRQLLEASLTALAPHYLVPLPRNPFFTGREEVLSTLHRTLGAEQVVAISQSYALHGLGGVGKTQIALEYAYRYALEYSAVFWIEAETSERMMSSVLRVAEVLRLPEQEDADQQHIIAAVQRWLGSHQQWLVIWDNLETLDLLQSWLPLGRQGAFLLTTRHQALGTVAQGIELPSLKEEEGVLFVLRRAKLLEAQGSVQQVQEWAACMPEEYAAARRLVAAMGGLPLALDQAGAYIEEMGCGMVGYLRRYEQGQARLLQRRGGPAGYHPDSVTTTFLLASERVEEECQEALALLQVCAFLHAEAIPEELFTASAGLLGTELEALAADPWQFDQAIALLRNMSLIHRQAQTQTLSIHRLVQAVLREQMSESQQVLWQQRVVAALNALFPESTYDTWGQCARLLPHVQACVSGLPVHLEELRLAEVLQKAADYLTQRAQYEQAEPLYQRALRIREQILGSEHPKVADALRNLGVWYTDCGKYEQAELVTERALHIREQALGPEHLDVAGALCGLAYIYWRRGKYKQAEPLYQRALHIREKVMGSEHPKVADVLNNLALLYYEQGQYELSESLHQQALRIWKQVLGPEHPDVAYSLNNLALLYWEQGKYEQGKPLAQQALRIWETSLGPEHPELIFPLLNLGRLFAGQGKDAQARELYTRALSITEQALGTMHPSAASILDDLACLDLEQNKYEQAEALSQQSLLIWEQVVGPEHPDVAATLNTLARISLEQGKDEQAEQLSQRALLIWQQTVGLEHPNSAFPFDTLATLYCKQGKYEQAESFYKQALHIREQSLDQFHPRIAQTLCGFAVLCQRQGNLQTAVSFAERALKIRSQALGDDYPQTVAAQELYALLTREHSSLMEA